MTLSTIKY